VLETLQEVDDEDLEDQMMAEWAEWVCPDGRKLSAALD